MDPDALTDALNAAATLHQRRFDRAADFDLTLARSEVLGTADAFYRWLTRPATLTVLPVTGTVRDQQTGQPTNTPTGDPMQLHDNEQVDVVVDTRDAKGFATPDEITWTSSDETVAVVTGADDGDSKTATVVAGNPGSAVITVSDGTLSATLAVDVVPAGTATIAVTPGAPVEQPPTA